VARIGVVEIRGHGNNLDTVDESVGICGGRNEGYVEVLTVLEVDAIFSEQDVRVARIIISIGVEGRIEMLKEGVGACLD